MVNGIAVTPVDGVPIARAFMVPKEPNNQMKLVKVIPPGAAVIENVCALAAPEKARIKTTAQLKRIDFALAPFLKEKWRRV